MKLKRIFACVLATCTIICSLSFQGITSASGASEYDDGTIRDLTSVELVKKMGVGWNLGNTLDSCTSNKHCSESESKNFETSWGNPKATQQLFDTLKESGITAVRIPVTWFNHMGSAPDYKINTSWMDRVEEVVNYARKAGMYVILNIHHDGGGTSNGSWISSSSSENAANDWDKFITRYRAVWSQIAERFKDYSDYLVLESMNEVGFDNVSKTEGFSILNKINQEFVNIIRNSGGKNDKRHLLIAGYWTDITESCQGVVMPDDPANRCILSVHYYTPWNFCGEGKGTWGSDSDINQLKNLFNNLKTTFVDKGTPVIVGEYGVNSKANKEDRINWFKTVVQTCEDIGVATYIWDNGEEFNRQTNEWRTPELIKALVEIAGKKDDSASTSNLTTSKTTSNTSNSIIDSQKPKTSNTTSFISNSTVPAQKSTSVVVPKVAKIKKVTVTSKAKKKINVKWKKVKGAKGYEVQVSKSKKFKKILIKKNTSKTNIVIKSKYFKHKKIFYVRVRAYTTYKDKNGVKIKVKSKWNKVPRKIKIK